MKSQTQFFNINIESNLKQYAEANPSITNPLLLVREFINRFDVLDMYNLDGVGYKETFKVLYIAAKRVLDKPCKFNYSAHTDQHGTTYSMEDGSEYLINDNYRPISKADELLFDWIQECEMNDQKKAERMRKLWFSKIF